MNSLLLVGAGGALGAMARFGVGHWAGQVYRGSFPLGTFTVNLLGSLAMGLLIGWLVRTVPDWQASARLFVAVGILGGFTTFSAFSLDMITLIERGELTTAMTYGLMSLVIPVGALYLGLMLMRVGGPA